MGTASHEPRADRLQPDWQPDPAGRHEYRYFDGVRWTDHVADHGQSTKDPYTLPPPGPTAPAVAPTAPVPTPVVPQDPTGPVWARDAGAQAETVTTGPKSREVYGSGTWDFVSVLILCLLFPFVALWYGPKLLFTGHVRRGLIVLVMTAVWFSTVMRML